MSITAGQLASASDFISTSAGAGDSGKVPKLNASGVLDTSFVSPNIKVGATTKDISNTTTTTITHGVGKTPTLIRLTMNMVGDSTDVQQVVLLATAGGVNWQYSGIQTGTFTAESASNGTGYFRFFKRIDSADNWNDGTVTFDGTNITITWSKMNSPVGTLNILWEAYA
jgi:hypothetical protein